MRKKLIALTTILGLIAFSGIAAAQEEEPGDSEDTTFNFGYDQGNGVFIWGSSPGDGEDCTLENGELEVVYGDHGDGGLLVEDLAYVEGDTVDLEACQVNAGEVAGPQGQVNHGMFLKLFNSMFDGRGRGCLVRHIAQSDLGKGDQQINVPDAEGTEGTGTEDPTGTIAFQTVMADCVHGPDAEAEVESQDNGKGRPAWVTEMLEDKRGGGDDGVEQHDGVESENQGSGRRGPPDNTPGKGPKG